jgi:hypothetical protein
VLPARRTAPRRPSRDHDVVGETVTRTTSGMRLNGSEDNLRLVFDREFEKTLTSVVEVSSVHVDQVAAGEFGDVGGEACGEVGDDCLRVGVGVETDAVGVEEMLDDGRQRGRREAGAH